MEISVIRSIFVFIRLWSEIFVIEVSEIVIILWINGIYCFMIVYVETVCVVFLRIKISE